MLSVVTCESSTICQLQLKFTFRNFIRFGYCDMPESPFSLRTILAEFHFFQFPHVPFNQLSLLNVMPSTIAHETAGGKEWRGRVRRGEAYGQIEMRWNRLLCAFVRCRSTVGGQWNAKKGILWQSYQRISCRKYYLPNRLTMYRYWSPHCPCPCSITWDQALMILVIEHDVSIGECKP